MVTTITVPRGVRQTKSREEVPSRLAGYLENLCLSNLHRKFALAQGSCCSDMGRHRQVNVNVHTC
jgi:hypothetical protein